MRGEPRVSSRSLLYDRPFHLLILYLSESCLDERGGVKHTMRGYAHAQVAPWLWSLWKTPFGSEDSSTYRLVYMYMKPSTPIEKLDSGRAIYTL